MSKSLIFLIIIVVFLFIAGMYDMKQEIAEQNTYCENVKMGKWPDYKDIYDTVCCDNEP